jgi:hypothetical protein
MWPLWIVLFVWTAALLLAHAADAQSVVHNPTRVQFSSPDHATNVSKYTVEYWLNTVDPATGTPFMTMTLAKADVTVFSETGPVYEALLSKLVPLPTLPVGQVYKATLTAHGLDETQVSARSGASNPFDRTSAPATPTTLSIR